MKGAARALALSLGKLPWVRRIILFGSRARGATAERAFIHLAVDLEGATARDWQLVMDAVEAVDTLLKIDCLRLVPITVDDPLRAIARDGIVLLDRGKAHDRSRAPATVPLCSAATG